MNSSVNSPSSVTVEVTAAEPARVRVPRTEGEAAEAPVISVVVVTHGTGGIVIDALAAVVERSRLPVEVVVVDNPPASGRPSGDLLRSLTSGVRLITPSTNLGFGGGNDLGVEHARGEFVCLLNPDAIVPDGWQHPLLAALDDPVVAIAGPVLLNPDGSLQEAGQLIYDDGCTAAIGGPEVMTGDESQRFSRDVDYVSAACWVMRRRDHLDLGGFDERYHPAFFEDADYALRVEQGGRRTRLVADVAVTHHRGDGGAGRDLALGEASREVFRSVWRERLLQQPPRPASDEQAVTNRDRLAERRVAWAARAGTADPESSSRALADARRYARSHPRERVTFITDDGGLAGLGDDAVHDSADGPIEAAELARARRAGVEVVVGDVDRTVEQRTGVVDTWHEVGGSPAPASRFVTPLWWVWTAVVFAVGLVLRVRVLRSPWGVLNSDEAYTGLQAMDILNGRLPVVVQGNTYTAVLEAYALAPFVRVFGPSILLLKLVPVVGWALAAVLTFYAARYLLGPFAGAVAGAFVWITPGALLFVSTLAYVGYALGMAVVVAALWASAWLIDRDRADPRHAALVGALAGLGLYIHPMYLAVLVPIVAPVAWWHRRQGRGFWFPFLAAGILVNGPFLAWNAVNGWPSLDVQNSLPGTYSERIETFVTELVPRGYGLRDVTFDWVFGRGPGLLAYAALVVAAVFGAVMMIRRSERRSRWLVPIALVAVWPLMALFSPLIWSEDGRYNVISFPLAAIAVASGMAALAERVPRRRRWAPAVLAVLVWTGVFVWPHLDRAVTTSTADPNSGLNEVVAFLEERGAERIAGSYWRVLVIEYAADRQIVGAVAPTWLWPVRFPERQRAVEATPPERVAFVFPTDGDDPSSLWLPPDRYERVVVSGTVVYLPLPGS